MSPYGVTRWQCHTVLSQFRSAPCNGLSNILIATDLKRVILNWICHTCIYQPDWLLYMLDVITRKYGFIWKVAGIEQGCISGMADWQYHICLLSAAEIWSPGRQMRPMNPPSDPRSYHRWSVWRPMDSLGFTENVSEWKWTDDSTDALV